jgi:hypothetical protein
VILAWAVCPAAEDSQTVRWLDVVHPAVAVMAVDVVEAEGSDHLDRTMDRQFRR